MILCGVATSTGVESTACAAHEHGYHVVIVIVIASDAVSDHDADADADAHHNSTIGIFPRLAETGTATDVLALLNTAANRVDKA